MVAQHSGGGCYWVDWEAQVSRFMQAGSECQMEKVSTLAHTARSPSLRVERCSWLPGLLTAWLDRSLRQTPGDPPPQTWQAPELACRRSASQARLLHWRQVPRGAWRLGKTSGVLRARAGPQEQKQALWIRATRCFAAS